MMMHLFRALLVLSLPISATVNAQSIFVDLADFTVNKSCSAYDSIKKENNPTQLQIGKVYVAIGENKAAGATHAFIKIDGKKKWVNLECGTYVNGKPGFGGSTQTNSRNKTGEQSSGTCLRFFDNETNPIKTRTGFKDITPQAPTLNKFDKDVLQFCGSPGKVTTAEGFKSLMKANPDALKNLFNFTGGKVFQDKTKNADLNSYLNDLTKAWYALHGFDHIFCGEKNRRSIGGLHFHGRYQQLESTNQLCRMNNSSSNEVIEGSIYSMGVEMKLANNEVIRHSIKGYGLTLNASDILLSATKAFSENHTSSNKSEACLLKLSDSDTLYNMVFVRRSNGIRTYYPDATPGKDNPCKQAISLN